MKECVESLYVLMACRGESDEEVTVGVGWAVCHLLVSLPTVRWRWPPVWLLLSSYYTAGPRRVLDMLLQRAKHVLVNRRMI